jgi:F-type H+-transporting ATPase subunit b
MLIDWFTLIAQVFNFLILLWLLKRFLFKPILKAIDEREKKIKEQILGAETALKEAEEEKARYSVKNREFDQERELLLEEAVEKARLKRKEMLDQARLEAEELRRQFEQSVREKQVHLSREITERTQKEVVAIARKVLTDLASVSLEEHMTRVFIDRLQRAGESQREILEKVLDGASGEVVVISAFALLPEQEARIEEALAAISSVPVKCLFEVDAGKINGIELHVHGYKMAWSVADYLRSLERQLTDLLDTRSEFQFVSHPSSNEYST